MQRTYHYAEIGPTRAEGDMFERLVALGRRQVFRNGDPVLHRGDPGNGFWLIESGNVMACRFGTEGERVLFAVLGRGDLIGELACFARLTQQVHAIAESEATLVWIDQSLIDQLLSEGPDFAQWLLFAMANKLRTALDRVEGGFTLPASARIARVLSELTANAGPVIDMTQQQLADHVGVSRVTAGQILRQFAEEGLIKRRYGKLEITDIEGLSRRSH